MSGGREAFRRAAFWGGCFTLLLAVRLCYVRVLWVDEAYGLAAARRILEGAALYRDIWFDKPPLYAWIYLLWGAKDGWLLRVGGALFALLCCWLAARTAAALFGSLEGRFAAAGMAFFLAFDHPSATISLAPDLLLIPFTLGAIWAVVRNRPLLAGGCAAAGLLANAKALLLLPLLIFWRPSGWRQTAGAYLLTAAGVCLAAWGWWEPVWVWGSLYSSHTFVLNPVAEAIKRTANWAGFHAALVLAGGAYFVRANEHRRHFALWFSAALAMVAAGARFFPRYYFALLPPAVVTAARGVCLVRRRGFAALLALTLAVPAVRFGMRHVDTLRSRPAAMRDLAMWEECRQAATRLRSLSSPGDTLFVWGYRPELNVLAGMPGTTRFLDSQPLTGVFADRHLTSREASAAALARRNRKELVRFRPSFIADGLGPYNPSLAITQFEDLRDWLAHYQLVAQTPGFRIYRRQ